MLHSQARNKFVGRQREMAELTAALNDALAGRGRMVMLAGEPGIGKTRTAQELASYAEGQGAKVFWGWCYEEEGAPPYWPWVQTMRSYVQQANGEQLIAEMGPGAADIAEIVPNIRSKITDLETPPDLEPEAARFRLFDSITTFLKNASQSQPLLLILDDLHWADRSSLLLLEFLARELGESRILVVGCYRDTELSRQHLLAETLAQLSREPVFGRQVLRGLGLDELGPFVEAITGFQLSRELTDTLHAHTEGNPFFMTEVIRLLSESGELSAGHIGTPEGLRIPEGVREVIGQRLNRLSKQCNEVLTTASIIGREFDFRLLNVLSGGMCEDQLLRLVDEAVSFHLIDDVPGQMERYQFSHALIQQTLTDELTTSRKVRLHARIGQALEELYGDDAEAHAAELAHHFAEAHTSTGPEKLVRYSLLAGERALATFAYEEALDHFERALESKGVPSDGLEQALDEESALLLFGLGRAQAATLSRLQIRVAVTNLSRAFHYFAASGDVERAVDVAEWPVMSFPGYPSGIDEVIARALELIPPDSHRAGRLLSRYGIAMGQEHNDYSIAQDAFSRAVTIAQSYQDPALEMRTLANSASVDIFHQQWSHCLNNVHDVIALGQSTDELQAKVLAHYSGVSVRYHQGELAAARGHAEALLPLAQRLRDHYWLATAFSRMDILSRAVGDWQTARHFNDQGLAMAPQDPRLLCCRALTEYESGNFDAGASYLNRFLDSVNLSAPGPTTINSLTAPLVSMVARISGSSAGFDVAEDAAQAVLESSLVSPNFAIWATSGLALIAAHRGDPAAALDLEGALRPAQGTNLGVLGINVSRVLGLLSSDMGRFEQAITDFEDSLAFCRKAGYRPQLAWTCWDYADAMLQRASTGSAQAGRGDRARAMSLLDEALAISTELGMLPLKQRVTEQLERVDTRPEAAPAYPGGLTRREVEVLGLVAAGRTDREISEELVIGVRTVTTHVGNILNKIGAANRAEASSFATRNGLA